MINNKIFIVYTSSTEGKFFTDTHDADAFARELLRYGRHADVLEIDPAQIEDDAREDERRTMDSEEEDNA